MAASSATSAKQTRPGETFLHRVSWCFRIAHPKRGMHRGHLCDIIIDMAAHQNILLAVSLMAWILLDMDGL